MENNNNNNMQITQSNGIHCKVEYENQFRRFLFNGTGFTSLKEQVKQLLDLSSEFVLKYKDNEDDLITVSTDEELNFALTWISGNTLRLFVDSANSQGKTTQEPTYNGPQQGHLGGGRHGKWRGGKCGRGHHGPMITPPSPGAIAPSGVPSVPHDGPHYGGPYGPHHGGPHHGGPYGHHYGPHHGGQHYGPYFREGCDKDMRELKKQKLIYKKNFFLNQLSELPPNIEQLNPQQLARYHNLKSKVCRIDAWIAKLDSKSNSADGKFCMRKSMDEKKYMKKCKKIQKQKKKEEKKKQPKIELSPEAVSEIQALKIQIKEYKGPLKHLKQECKQKKNMCKLLRSEGKDVSELVHQIQALKIEVLQKKDLIYPLKSRVREIKRGNTNM